MEKVSIVFPLYYPESSIVRDILKRLMLQGKSANLELIVINKEIDDKTSALIQQAGMSINIREIRVPNNISFSSSMNMGIKNSKNSIVVILQQDCIPVGKNWLKELISSFSDKEVVASVSKVELPFSLWNSFDAISKILSAKEQGIITPLLDEKGCAYRLSALKKIGFFNESRFNTAGEDFDVYMKIIQLGKISYPDVKLLHYHKYTWIKRLKKELQLSNAFGTLVACYGTALPRWYAGVFKSIPFIGFPLFLAKVSIKRLNWLILPAIPLYFLVHLLYIYGFWKGFLMKKQTI